MIWRKTVEGRKERDFCKLYDHHIRNDNVKRFVYHVTYRQHSFITMFVVCLTESIICMIYVGRCIPGIL